MVDASDHRLDRYLAGELSLAEQRQLAQASLDDAELFDTLTAAAVAKAAMLQDDEVHRTPARLHAYGWNRLALAGTIGAAAAVLMLVLVYRSPWPTRPTSTASVPPDSSPSIGAAETAAARTVTAPPVILTARLDQTGGGSRVEFRSLDAGGRSPRGTGVVVSVDDGEVTVDLGAIDGLDKGAEVEVFRGSDQQPIGRLTMTTIFRERARGRTTASGVNAGDRVELAPATRVAALLEQVEARISAGDASMALAFAARAVASSEAPGVSADMRRKALDRLGTLEHRAGSFDQSARHLRLAVDAFDVAPAAAAAARARTLNELGAVLVDLGQHADADRILRLAEAQATGADRVRTTNNLGALAALRGDRAAAESMYRAALIQAGDTPDLESDRRSIQNNLEAVTAPR